MSRRIDSIIQTAEKLFSENGFVATSMRDIARSEGIEVASLYSHINSKDELLEKICFRIADEFITAIHEVNDIYFNAEEKLRMAVRLHVNIITRDLDASKVFLKEWRHLKEPRLSEFKKLRHEYEDGFRRILINGENENVFETHDKKFAVLTILSALNWITEWYRTDGNMTPDEIADHLTDFILSGLKVKSSVESK
jgi:AcrR family transcriptional regulator